jgi:solute carrier family 25 protein 44
VVASIGNGVAALASVLASQLIYVPVDVVTQRVMTTPVSGSEVFRSVLANEGFIGLYRGFGLSLLAYLPAQSLWWGTYGGVQAAIAERSASDLGTFGTLAAQGFSSTLAATGVVAGTSPLDLVKTRVQLSESATPFAETMAQIRREGMSSLYKGSRARLTHMTIWGFVMISVYEELKRVCTVPGSMA